MFPWHLVAMFCQAGSNNEGIAIACHSCHIVSELRGQPIQKVVCWLKYPAQDYAQQQKLLLLCWDSQDPLRTGEERYAICWLLPVRSVACPVHFLVFFSRDAAGLDFAAGWKTHFERHVLYWHSDIIWKN